MGCRYMNGAEEEVRACAQALLDAGWEMRPNPVVAGWCDVQLSITYKRDGRAYVAVVVLRADTHSAILNAEAQYNPYSPFESHVVSERTLPAVEALHLALALTDEVRTQSRQKDRSTYEWLGNESRGTA